MTTTHAKAFDHLLATWNHRQDLRSSGASFEARLNAERNLAEARRQMSDVRIAA